MLNSETKRRIDACRDILVGKVPDPKAQVEQITTALIYKFMDDMDAEAESIGGKPAFFAGKLKEFRWTKLMSKQLSGQERMDLYIRATTAFGNAEALPRLFRDIFKSAFIPYRDSETLNLFLKEIDGFSYDHSEDLGDAYEYLLSVLGSQGDAGQFRTPRHIIDFIVQAVDPDINQSILDPACGTAGFLISAYRHIAKKYDGENNRRLGKSDRERLIKNITGYDISPDMVRISKVNMYLHNFPEPNIYEYDTLTSEERWNDYFDVILANPPFMTPKGGVRPHNKFSIPANRTEVLFSDYILDHLKPGGRAGFIVPEGIIFQSGNAYKQLRKMLVDDGYLWAVVSLPAGVFQPYSGVKTSILLIDRNLAKANENILFVKVGNDGFDLGAQRRPMPDKNDLPLALVLLREYKATHVIPANAGIQALLTEKKKIAASGDYNLSMERYRETLSHATQKWPIVKLGDVAEINPNKNGLDAKDIDVTFLPMSDLSENEMSFVPKQVKKISEVCKGYTYFANNDVLVAKVTPCFENGKAGVASGLVNGIGFGSTEIVVLRPNSNLKPELLFHYVTSDNFRSGGEEQMTGTGGLQRVPKSYFASYEIPLPPLAVQEALVAELERYRKMIEGARAIIQNYKPEIEIDPKWPLLSINDICAIGDGNHSSNYPKASEMVVSGVPFIRASNLNDGNIDAKDMKFISAEKHALLKKGHLKAGDVLFSNRGEIGKVALVDARFDNANLNSQLAWLRSGSQLSPRYLLTVLQSSYVQDRLLGEKNGATLQQYTIKQLKELTIPLPSLSEQQSIVARLETERAEIAMLKGLIARMEGKIKAKVAALWG